MRQQLKLPIDTGSRWSLQVGDTIADNALHPAQRRLIPRANAEGSSIALNTSLNITQLTGSSLPPWRFQRGRDVGERR
jgi:hypothetical protein